MQKKFALPQFAPYLFAAVLTSTPLTYAQISEEQDSEEQNSREQENELPTPPETHTCTATICFPASHQQCDAELESRITSLQLTVSLSNYVLLLEGKTEQNEYCTLLEQKVIVGKKDWRTPRMETTLSYALTFPAWYPTQRIIEEMKEQYPEEYAALLFDEKVQKHYVPSGQNNPLGTAKFVLNTPHKVFIHGTPHKSLFTKEKRDFSHGCMRIEDEVALLKVLSRAAGSDCDEACIEQTIAHSRSRKIYFERSIAVKIVDE